MTESPKDLAEEAQRGRSERTPWIALSGVALVLTIFCAVVIAAALILYYVV